MKALKIALIGIALLLIQACSHPIEIEGFGDVTSTSIRGCTYEESIADEPPERCAKNYVVVAYEETYTATPRTAGWYFDRWVNYCTTPTDPKNECKFTATAAQVKAFWGATVPPLKVVFVTQCGDGLKAGPEECDDGNTADGDLCSATCTTELDTDGDGVPDVTDHCPLVGPNLNGLGCPWLLSVLNDTGNTFGGDYPSGNNAGCTGATIAQQDCSHGRDATHNDNADGHAGFSYTKLASNGAVLPASAVSWACVRDNVTGLVWENKTDDGGIHDKDNTYRWGGKTAQGTGYGTYYSDWDTLVDGSNNAALCGYTDWRVPTRFQLQSLVNFNRYNPAIDTAYFPTNASFVWSASPYADLDPDYAWFVSFSDGISSTGDGDRSYGNTFGVRLVRSGQ